VWSQTARGGRLAVQIELFVEPAAATRRAAEEEAERLAAFVGAALDLTWA